MQFHQAQSPALLSIEADLWVRPILVANIQFSIVALVLVHRTAPSQHTRATTSFAELESARNKRLEYLIGVVLLRDVPHELKVLSAIASKRVLERRSVVEELERMIHTHVCGVVADSRQPYLCSMVDLIIVSLVFPVRVQADHCKNVSLRHKHESKVYSLIRLLMVLFKPITLPPRSVPRSV